MYGARVTDAVDFLRRRGEPRTAVRAVRKRAPDKFRWRDAVSVLTATAGVRRGRDRMFIEEPIREVVIDLPDYLLRREVVLDARRNHVDLDRGELLPRHTIGDLRRTSFLIGTDLSRVQRYVKLPDGFDAPIDTAAVVLVGRALAKLHHKRAQKLRLQLPVPDGPEGFFELQHSAMADRAERDAEEATRWAALARALLGERPRPADGEIIPSF